MGDRRKNPLALVAFLAALFLLTSCVASEELLVRAREDVEAARAVDAPTWAPEHFSLAISELGEAERLFLEKKTEADIHSREASHKAELAREVTRFASKLSVIEGKVGVLAPELTNTREESTRLARERERLAEESGALLEKLNGAIAKLAAANAEIAQLKANESAQEKQIVALQSSNEWLAKEVKTGGADLRECEEKRDRVIAEASETAAWAGWCGDELEEKARLWEECEESAQELDELVEELRLESEELVLRNSELEELLAERVEELEEKRRAAESAGKENEQLLKDLKGLESKHIKLKEESGRLILTFLEKVLFESGKAELLPEGREGLRKVAAVLRDYPERVIQVGGHTDAVPIATARFPSNWELSTARAVTVVKFLLSVEPDIIASNLMAAGFGEHRPVETNETPEGRQENRRVEIVILRGKLE